MPQPGSPTTEGTVSPVLVIVVIAMLIVGAIALREFGR